MFLFCLKFVCLFVCTFSNCIHLVLNKCEIVERNYKFVAKFSHVYKYSNNCKFVQSQNMNRITIIVLLHHFMHLVKAQNCSYTNDTKSALCNNLTCYNVLKREVRSLSLKNSCYLEFDDWENFTNTIPSLHTMSFDPYCQNCLKIDKNFNKKLHVHGRCLEKQLKSVDLSHITNEIAACLSFLILLTILYAIKFIKHKIMHFFAPSNLTSESSRFLFSRQP